MSAGKRLWAVGIVLAGWTLVDRGETVAVIGPSGSGKSTLLACLAGLDEPAGGSVWVAGERLSHRSEAERARIRAARIDVLLQSRNLVPHLDVRANVRIARGAVRRAGPRGPVDELIARVGLAGRARAVPAQLSGGSWPGPGWPSRWPTRRTSSWPTNRPESSTGRRNSKCSPCCVTT
jgi:predicted ABC-type transport system involved in lysophospholipase L1 biosynthesis ATPase subunit